MNERRPPGNKLDPETREIHARLEEWGKWARDHEAQGFPPETILARLIAAGPVGAGHSGAAPISIPERVAAIDRAVCRLPAQEKRAVIAYYTHWEPPEVTAKHMKVRLGKFREIIRRARLRLAAIV